VTADSVVDLSQFPHGDMTAKFVAVAHAVFMRDVV
jgi:hypothetical protein